MSKFPVNLFTDPIQKGSPMQEKPIVRRIRLLYGIFLSLLILLVGVLLIRSCVDIYTSGRRPFSPASIAAHYRAIEIPLLLTLCMLTVGIVLAALFPHDARVKPVRDESDLHAAMHRRFVLPPCPKETRLRRVIRITAGTLIAALFVYPTLYFLNPDHFSAHDPNASIRTATVVLLIPTALSLLLASIASLLLKHSYTRELRQAKAEIAEHRASRRTEAPKPTAAEHVRFTLSKKSVLLGVRIVLFSVAVLFIVLGILNDGIGDVLGKAAAICTECIGLG